MLHDLLVTIKKPFVRLVPVPEPECRIGSGKVKEVDRVLATAGCRRPLVVTDGALMKHGLLDEMLASLASAGMAPQLFSQVTPDPTAELVREGVALYHQQQCDSVIAFGGGSSIDCGKGIAASVATGKDILRLTGLLKVRRRLPPLIAVPTTAGSGSEATVAAVISDRASRTKHVVTDPALIPVVAILDPALMVGLPRQMTAETGVDALTHAIESWLSRYASGHTRQLCSEAVRAILTHLPAAYADGTNMAAREAMSVASFKAGAAFTRTYIGYVHAISHQLGGYYHVPHGQANAILLPRLLEFNFEATLKPLAQLARAAGLTDEPDNRKAATVLVAAVSRLLEELNMPSQVDSLRRDDIPELARRAVKEAFGVYPVPRAMSVSQCEQILHSVL